jgi:hypothetical protein
MCAAAQQKTAVSVGTSDRPRPLGSGRVAPSRNFSKSRREFLKTSCAALAVNVLAADFSFADEPPRTVGVVPTSKSGRTYKVAQPEAPPSAPRYEPWPPPKPSATHRYPEKFLKPFRGKTLGDFWDAFAPTLKAADYEWVSIYSRPDGLVIVLPLELENEGYPAATGRFSYGTTGVPGFVDGLGRLFVPTTGHARWILFVLAPSGKPASTPPESFASQRAFHLAGKPTLPDDLRSWVIKNTDRFCAHIYEYRIPKREEPVFVDTSRTDAADHLRRSRLPAGEGL